LDPESILPSASQEIALRYLLIFDIDGRPKITAGDALKFLGKPGIPIKKCPVRLPFAISILGTVSCQNFWYAAATSEGRLYLFQLISNCGSNSLIFKRVHVVLELYSGTSTKAHHDHREHQRNSKYFGFEIAQVLRL
jgi:hypothetical protein